MCVFSNCFSAVFLLRAWRGYCFAQMHLAKAEEVGPLCTQRKAAGIGIKFAEVVTFIHIVCPLQVSTFHLQRDELDLFSGLRVPLVGISAGFSSVEK